MRNSKASIFLNEFFGRRVLGRHAPHFSLWVLSKILREKRVESMRRKIFPKIFKKVQKDA